MKPIRYILSALAATILFGCSAPEFERNFQNPEQVQTAVYWYWISGNISKEGVIADLHAMKQAGINRAFIGDIGQDGFYTDRSVKIFTDEWWEVLHTALKTASELGIEIGIFNSPGWSQSGGPWVKPEQAMRYLASQEYFVEGGKEVSMVLTPHIQPFQPVRTIAYPAPKGYAGAGECKITPADLTALTAGKPNIIKIEYPTEVTVRSLTITPTPTGMLTTAHLDAKVAGEWKRIASQTPFVDTPLRLGDPQKWKARAWRLPARSREIRWGAVRLRFCTYRGASTKGPDCKCRW